MTRRARTPEPGSESGSSRDPLAFAQASTRGWFRRSFEAPTAAQVQGWPSIVAGRSTLLLAPTGSGKTLAAFLVALDRLMARPEAAGAASAAPQSRGCRVLYVSPLKALGVDVERNLRAPLVGIAAEAEAMGVPCRVPSVGVRSGDTPPRERARQLRHPPDILITTPESLFLMLTSRARENLRGVETVIVDEIHSMVATKRGAHLFLSLERLEALRVGPNGEPPAPLQRIGLSATQRPLDEVARLLGGYALDGSGERRPRDVVVVDAGRRKALDLRVEVAVEDMARLGETASQLPRLEDLEGYASGPASEAELDARDEPDPDDALDADIRSGPAAASAVPGGLGRSIWPSIHPRLVALIRAHRSTMVFVNSRRMAERLAAALNELAGEALARAHHGSIAKETRAQIEDALKRGELPALVATSSMELGIDMGAVDQVIQIEAPPSVASGLQRIGRAGHHVGGRSRGVVFPKFRGDLLACAAVSERMHLGEVEETYYPRNPLDVLAQQVVAIAASAEIEVDALYDLVRGAAPFAQLPRRSFEGVLDMLSGRYPSDEFAGLVPRITWDRIAGTISARQGAQRTAVVNAGTIPDRGLYGVFLAGDEGRKAGRVGELDEEMVFESRAGDVFVLGASSWRIVDITHDRVLVAPAPGEPGKMPFWRGDQPGRPLALGRAIGALTRELCGIDEDTALERLRTRHDLDEFAARNLVAYLRDQVEATGEVPDDRRIVMERFVDEVGDWRVCLLSPFGARVHAPWATAVARRLRHELDLEVDLMWSDDGIVFRLPESDRPPESALFFPDPEEVEGLLVSELSQTAMFASHFRENAGRALLLPKRVPGKRTPLWMQRRRSADLLQTVSRYPDFPILLETYRECLRDVFDLGGLVSLLREVQSREVRVHVVDSERASPFASSLLFNYVGNFLYDGDAPLAERRAQALALDHAQLRELLGDAQLRDLLDGEAIDAHVLRLQRLDGAWPVRHADGLHDLLRSIGPLGEDEIRLRCEPGVDPGPWIEDLLRVRRIVRARFAGQARLAAVEDVARLRDALGVVPPPGLPQVFLEPAVGALDDLVARFARTHGPFRAEEVARWLGIGVAPVEGALSRLASRDRVLEGEFLPGGHGREWCDADVLRALKRRSLARLRAEVEPVDAAALGRFLPGWQGLQRRARGLDALLDVVEQLQGTGIPASVLERAVLPARVEGYSPTDLDELCVAGEVVWRGVEPIGQADGRVALFLADHAALLASPPVVVEGSLAEKLRRALDRRGALFFPDLVAEVGGFPGEVLDTLWSMVWAGEVSNDTLAPLRSLYRAASRGKRSSASGRRGRGFRTRRIVTPGTEGRWSLTPGPGAHSSTERSTAQARQLLSRHGVLTREAVRAEGISGGFSALYPVLRAMEEAGKIRRGYFVEGLGAAQFALPGAEDRLRVGIDHDAAPEERALLLAATDPANPYGAALPWPRVDGARGPSDRPMRAVGASVLLFDGELVGFVGRTGQTLQTFLPGEEPRRAHAMAGIALALARETDPLHASTITSIDGDEPGQSPLAAHLRRAGFVPSGRGYVLGAHPGARHARR